MPIDDDAERRRAAVRALPLAFALLSILWLLAFRAQQPGAPLPADAAATEFSALRALAVLRDLVGDSVPHPLGSAANAVVRGRILAQLRGMGYEPQLQAGPFECDRYGVCGTPTNIVARVGASSASDAGSVLLAAHYDSVPAGPGASDDAAGVAEALEIARLLKLRAPTPHPIVLLIADGEEVGLLGAQVFARHHPWARSIKAAVNIDNRGSSGPALMFETGTANGWLMNLYAAHVPHPLTNSVYYTAYKLLPNNTDFSVFKDAGYQGFNVGYIGDVANYHTPSDDYAHADARSIQNQGDAALAALLALAGGDIDHPPAGDAVYFDVFGSMLVRLPQALMLPAAAAALVAALLGIAGLLRRGRCSWKELLWSVSALLVAWSGAAVLTSALLWAYRLFSPAGLPEHAAMPWAPEVAAGALGALCGISVSILLCERVRFWAFWAAHALLLAGMAVAAAATVPGASYLVLIPAVIGVPALAFPLVGRREGAGVRATAALLHLTAMFTLLWPLLLLLYDGLGTTIACPVIALLVAVGAAPLAGLMLEADRRVSRGSALAAALVLLCGTAVIMVAPAYTPAAPEPLNIRYWLQYPEAGPPRARWLLVVRGHAPPASLERVAHFERLRPERYDTFLDFGGATAYAADAPRQDLPAPQFRVLTARAVAGPAAPRRMHYRIHASSPRGAAMLALAFPPQADIAAATVSAPASNGGAATPVVPRTVEWGWKVVYVANPGPEGVDLEFDAVREAFDVAVVDRSYALPAAGAALQAARPATTTTIQDGDVTLVRVTGHVTEPR